MDSALKFELEIKKRSAQHLGCFLLNGSYQEFEDYIFKSFFKQFWKSIFLLIYFVNTLLNTSFFIFFKILEISIPLSTI